MRQLRPNARNWRPAGLYRRTGKSPSLPFLHGGSAADGPHAQGCLCRPEGFSGHAPIGLDRLKRRRQRAMQSSTRWPGHRRVLGKASTTRNLSSPRSQDLLRRRPALNICDQVDASPKGGTREIEWQRQVATPSPVAAWIVYAELLPQREEQVPIKVDISVVVGVVDPVSIEHGLDRQRTAFEAFDVPLRRTGTLHRPVEPAHHVLAESKVQQLVMRVAVAVAEGLQPSVEQHWVRADRSGFFHVSPTVTNTH